MCLQQILARNFKILSNPITHSATAAVGVGAGVGSVGVAESLAGERLGGGSQRLQVPRLKSHKDDKRETVASFRAQRCGGNGRVARSRWRICGT